jgi:phosphoribosylanthranilate isomerase
MSHLRVKICGITNVADARAAADAGADAIGLNFYDKSPRFINDLPEIGRILIELPPFVEGVGLFVRETWREAYRKAKGYQLRCIQMHGDQHDPGFISGIKRIDAFRVSERNHLVSITDYLALAKEDGMMPHAVLIDAHVPGQFGGTGQRAPWDLLADFKPGIPLILAGGLTPENVAEAVKIVRPYAVDVASGVESSPGKKDVDKIKRFIENARSV